jgi:aryl sulfotransferase
VSGRTVWLVSYPKSGNTWLRAIVTSLGVHPHLFGVNQLGSGAQPYGVADAVGRLGLDPRWLDRGEMYRLRNSLIVLADRWAGDGELDDDQPAAPTTRAGAAPGDGAVSDAAAARVAPRLRKTHERFRTGVPGAEPFPTAASRAAILVVRDPRDVACSYAPFFGVSVDGAIDAMGGRTRSALSVGKASPAQCRTAQPWGTWSEHASSWLADDVGFAVHVVRYEDLRADAVATLAPVFDAIGLDCTTAELEAAVEAASFERLRASEEERGFREVSPNTERFFRRGEAGGWRDELTEAQVAAVEADHAEVMTRLGYELTTTEDQRAALAEALASRRRQVGRRWKELPGWLELEVREGDVPDELPGAEFPRRWLQTTRTATRVQFAGGRALLVEDGRYVTVSWPASDEDDDGGDLSWLVQGWSVTLSWMQRGNLSLHASTVRIGDEVVAIAGRQGAGKSTTSLAMRRRGHQLLVDDTTILTFADDGVFMTPYPRNVHLLPDAAAALGVDFDALPPLAGRVGKSAFLPEDPPPEPQRIDRIVVLTTPPEATAVALDDVRGADRVRALAAHVSRRGLAPVILGPQGFFERLSQLAGSTRVQVLSRPTDVWTLDEVLDAIEAGAALPLAQDA